jgi:hypothetical protein
VQAKKKKGLSYNYAHYSVTAYKCVSFLLVSPCSTATLAYDPKQLVTP